MAIQWGFRRFAGHRCRIQGDQLCRRKLLSVRQSPTFAQWLRGTSRQHPGAAASSARADPAEAAKIRTTTRDNETVMLIQIQHQETIKRPAAAKSPLPEYHPTHP